MAYTIYRADGTAVTVPDNAIDAQFYNPTANGVGKGQGIQLNGRNAIDYGAPTAQTWLQMTENFASNGILPLDATSLVGQLWYDKLTSTLNIKVTTGSGVNADNWVKVVTSTATGDVIVAPDLYVERDVYIGGDLNFTHLYPDPPGFPGARIRVTTADGGDNTRLYLNSAEIADPTRGAFISLSGNEATGSEGAVVISAGDPLGNASYVLVRGNVLFDDIVKFSFANVAANAVYTPLTKSVNVITSGTGSGTGVILPLPVAGYRIVVRNATGLATNVDPYGTAQINGGAPGGAISLPAGAMIEFICTQSGSSGEWFTMNSTYA